MILVFRLTNTGVVMATTSGCQTSAALLPLAVPWWLLLNLEGCASARGRSCGCHGKQQTVWDSCSSHRHEYGELSPKHLSSVAIHGASAFCIILSPGLIGPQDCRLELRS